MIGSRSLFYKYGFLLLYCLPLTVLAEDACKEAKRFVQKAVTLGDGSEAEADLYRAAIRKCPSLSEAYYNYALVHIKRSDFEEALVEIDRAIERRAKDSRYVLAKARIFLEQSRYADAEALYRKVKEWEPENAKALVGLSIIAKHQGDLKQAVKFLNEALLYRSSDKTTRYNLAVLYENLEKDDSALREYLTLLDLDSKHLLARRRAVIIYISQKRYQEAWGLLVADSIAELLASDSKLLALKGHVAKQRGELDKAELAYRAALDLEAADQHSRLELAQILIKKQQPALALELFQGQDLDQIEDRKLVSALYNALGLAQLDLGKLSQAEESLQAAVALNKQNAHALNNLGVLYQRTKRHQLAESKFVQAIEINDSFTEARENLKTLQSLIEEGLGE